MTKHEILKKYWGYDSFRGIQEQIIDEIMAGRDVLGLMPTGGGKSLTFQVPALAMEGVCLVISPLIALMKDQVQNLRKRNIKAAAIYSGMSHSKALETMENAVYGGVKILYVSPERLESELFRAKLQHMKISFFTIDESHCICQWGYDFRPSYLKIAEIRDIHPKAPVLALTATATNETAEDIQHQLKFRAKNCIKMSFERPNIAYIVQRSKEKLSDVANILQKNEGTAIIYVSSRERTTEIADFLQKLDITAEGYNAGLTAMHRDIRQQKWTDDRTRVIVATNAFGMGIDKPDVRVVIHLNCPTSIEAYFQEAGRAGRDGKPAKAVLLVSDYDSAILKKKINYNYPEKDFILRVYECLCYFYEIGVGYGIGVSKVFNIEEFCRIYRFFPTSVTAALHILSRAGYINYEDERDAQSRIRFIVDRDELYDIGHIPEQQNEFMQFLLRRYTGLFTSYVPIFEEEIEKNTGHPAQEVYDMLVELSRLGIIRYIPRSKEPLVTFTINRIDSENFVLPDSCYKSLKDAFAKRVHKMIDYIENDSDCRSAQLLNYFCEHADKKCGICDVCQHEKRAKNDDTITNTIESHIYKILSDRQKHHISELYTPDIPTTELARIIKQLLEEDKIKSVGALISLK
ncbi:MAG: RecQ family ATP-dependent DNA helicase [Bacteroidaceae bacterium]|nr:RecQ family ATP-dependent DNA helicase [Bacteroidaceae bacterium]